MRPSHRSRELHPGEQTRLGPIKATNQLRIAILIRGLLEAFTEPCELHLRDETIASSTALSGTGGGGTLPEFG